MERLLPHRLPARYRYAVAALSVGAALAGQLALRPLTYSIPFIFFILAVAISGWFGGAGAGLFATVASAGLGNYFFVAPVGRPSLSGGALLATGLFVLVGALVCLFSATLQRRYDEIDGLRSREEAMQEELRGATGRLELALRSTGLGTWQLDLARGTASCDPRAQAILGMPASFTLAAFDARIHPEDRPKLAALASGVELGTMEYRLLGEHPGSERWIRATWQRSGPGGAQRAVGTVQDATAEVRRAEELALLAEVGTALLSSTGYDETLQRLVQLCVPAMADWAGIDLRQPDGTLRRLTSWHRDPRKRELGRELIERFPPRLEAPGGYGEVLRSGRPQLVADLWAAAAHAPPMPAPQQALVKELGLHSLIAVPLRAQGQVIGVFSFANAENPRAFDADDLRRAEAVAERAGLALDAVRLFEANRQERERAEAASRSKDEFLAVVSHELRTPLTAILGYSSLLRDHDHPERRARAADVIERNARALTQLVEDLLDVSQIVSGKLMLDLRPVLPEEPVRRAVESVRPAAQARRIALDVHLEPIAEPVSADPARLQQVAWNLLSNAVKFTPAGGKVTVGLREVGQELELAVEDTGQGIAPEFLPYVFDRFSQADASSTRRTGGLGLGLAIVRHVAELHGGTVAVQSPGPGKGSRFVVRLPLRRPEPLASLPAPAPASPLHGLHVLVVEDEPDSRDYLVELLQGSGARVTAAATVAEALADVARERPDVVVSDLAMPGQDGYALLDGLRKLEPRPGVNLPAVAVSAHVRDEDKRRALTAGFVAHVGKPLDAAALLQEVARAARGPAKA